MSIQILNPGSPDAVREGCQCAIIDNHYGAGIILNGKQEFWISGDCPLHGLDIMKNKEE